MLNFITNNAKYYDMVMKKKTVKEVLCGTLEYKKWIILWDLLNFDLCHILYDLKNEKITIDDVKEVIEKSNSIENIFDTDFILEQITM